MAGQGLKDWIQAFSRQFGGLQEVGLNAGRWHCSERGWEGLGGPALWPKEPILASGTRLGQHVADGNVA